MTRPEPAASTARSLRAARRLRDLDRVRVDEGAVLVLAAAMGLQLWLSTGVDGRLAGSVAGAVLAVAVAVRRRWPLAALLGGTATVTTDALLGAALVEHAVAAILAAVLLFYAAGAFLGTRRARFALVASVLVMLIQVFRTPHVASDLVFEPVIVALIPWVCGRLMREQAHRVQASRQLAEQLDAAREQHATAVADSERLRITRELHDVIGHCLSVIVLQSGGARMVLESEPARAHEAMFVVERAGREALTEIRHLLGMSGDADAGAGIGPQPGMADIAALVSVASSAGLTAELTVEGTPVCVSPALGLCAYRIVQEALTNAIKHAGAARARVRVCWAGDQLHLEIADDGRGLVPARGAADAAVSSAASGAGGAARAAASGHGIAGMRQRAELHQGTLQAGPQPAGGYLVRATLALTQETLPPTNQSPR